MVGHNGDLNAKRIVNFFFFEVDLILSNFRLCLFSIYLFVV